MRCHATPCDLTPRLPHLYVGAEGNEGDIYVCNDAGETTFRVDGNEGDLVIRSSARRADA